MCFDMIHCHRKVFSPSYELPIEGEHTETNEIEPR